jgi:hypothetical protein
MNIIQTTKCIFFHNPRTGGNSLSTEFGEKQYLNPLQHMSPARAKFWIFKETWDDYWKFSFVRNPWDRYVSLYHHLNWGANGPRPQMNNETAPKYKFDEWLYLSVNKFIISEVAGTPQTRWTEETNIFKFEERDAAIPIIAERTGFDLKNIRTNESKHGFYADYYTKKSTIELVTDIDRETIKRFGYKFGE